MILPCGHNSDTINPSITDGTKKGGCAVCHAWLHNPALKAHYERLPSQKSIAKTQRIACVHLGEATGEEVACSTCQGNVRIKTLACEIYGKCSPVKKLDGIACCVSCPDYIAPTPEIG